MNIFIDQILLSRMTYVGTDRGVIEVFDLFDVSENLFHVINVKEHGYVLDGGI